MAEMEPQYAYAVACPDCDDPVAVLFSVEAKALSSKGGNYTIKLTQSGPMVCSKCGFEYRPTTKRLVEGGMGDE